MRENVKKIVKGILEENEIPTTGKGKKATSKQKIQINFCLNPGAFLKHKLKLGTL